MYLEGLSLQTICDILNSAGHRTLMGSLFQESSLNTLIHNEIYAGDIRRQKTFMESPLTKVKVINRGQLPQFYYEDSHECCPYVNTIAPSQKARKLGVSWDYGFAPSAQNAWPDREKTLKWLLSGVGNAPHRRTGRIQINSDLPDGLLADVIFLRERKNTL